ncbi:MAG: hypothetical protein WCK58_15675 [Chloroflexota bacterium]
MHRARPVARRLLVALAATALLLAGGTAIAATAWAPGPDGVVAACRNTSTGILRVLSDTRATCKSTEQRVTWERNGNLRSGTGAPAATLGIAGDFYYATDTHRLFGPRTAAGWGTGIVVGLPTGAGTAGFNTILSGLGAPPAAAGSDGDFWLDIATMTMWGPRAMGAWLGSGTALTGQQGDQGPQGAPGPQGDPGAPGLPGADGTTIRSGTGAPPAGTGNNGDLWLDTATHAVYGPRTAAGWGSPTALTGPAGVAGASDLLRPRFTRTTIDSTGVVGYFIGVTIGVDGLPLVSYQDATRQALRVAHCSDMACTSATLLDADAKAGEVGMFSSIAIGGDGLGLIAYHDSANGDLRTAHCTDAVCSSVTTAAVDTAGDVGYQTSIATGTDGRGLISYGDVTNGNLKVAHCANAACTSVTASTIDSTGNVGLYTSIAIGADGLGLVSYVDADNATLKVAHCANTACTSATVTALDSASPTGYYTSITVGSDGLGLVSYPAGANATLKVAHCSNVACTAATPTELAAQTNAGQETAISMGRDGLGIIAYFDPGVGDLRVAHCTNVACTSAIISTVDDTSATTGVNPSIAIGMDGLPVIAYCDYTNGDLKVAHLPNRLGSPYVRSR